ncbi:hypothetical protein [Paracoccus sediminicola]|uniref:hypothetical protein n=1 Tax=Paracoccus sediminicola TaxID=3017783 RepID=UPI0022F10B82|nr:hypothetical protein [Paracoccus sediminicola]WBU56221.1 hypothetical protein PAF18_12070 [Paracoccus sediminicola]
MKTIRLDGQDDRDLAKVLARNLRSEDGLEVVGLASEGVGPDAVGWIRALDDARIPVSVRISGKVGMRGILLLLLADRSAVEEGSASAAGFHPLIAVVASARLGSLAARRLARAKDHLSVLRDEGVIATGPEIKGERQVWRAIRELPFSEALDFAAAATRQSHNKEEHSDEHRSTL